MKTMTQLSTALAASAMLAGSASAAIVGPYSSDANTLHLWQFNEADNTATTTAATVGGVALNKANDATLGNTSFSGFGNAGNTSAGDDADFLSADSFNVSTVTGTGGAFTFEAMINISSTGALQQIFSMEGNENSTRPFQFRVFEDELAFFNIEGGGAVEIAIPTTGDDAFAANQWFHVAVTYDGNENTPDNTSLYWTRVDASRTEANLLGTGTLTGDLSASARYGVGNDARTDGDQDKNLEGLIDEVRISNIARGPDDMLFVPEPSSLALLGLGGLCLIKRRRRGA